APNVAVVTYESRDVCVVGALEIHGPASQTVVPPEGDSVPFYQLQESLKHGLFEDRTGSTTVGVAAGEQWIRASVSVVTERRRQIARLLRRQRPERGPVDLDVLPKRLGYPMGLVSSRVV